MTTHTIVVSPYPGPSLAWDNTDRPTSIEVYSTQGVNGDGILVATIPASSIDANGVFSVTLDEATRRDQPLNPNHFFYAMIMRGAAHHVIDPALVIISNDGTWPTTSYYAYKAVTNTTGDVTFTGTIKDYTYPDIPLDVGVLEFSLRTTGVWSGETHDYDVTTDVDGAYSVLLHNMHDETVAITPLTVNHPYLSFSDGISNICEPGLTGPFTWDLTFFQPRGENSVRFTCPALTKYGGGAWIYADTQKYVLPDSGQMNNLNPGNVVFTFEKLGTGPYLIEIWVNSEDHDWDAWWPHIDEANDPDAWNASAATAFTLDPGVNDLGMFVIKDYPDVCTVGSADLITKLSRVGFIARTTVEILAGDLSTERSLQRAGLSPRQAKTLQQVDLGPIVPPAVTDPLVEVDRLTFPLVDFVTVHYRCRNLPAADGLTTAFTVSAPGQGSWSMYFLMPGQTWADYDDQGTWLDGTVTGTVDDFSGTAIIKDVTGWLGSGAVGLTATIEQAKLVETTLTENVYSVSLVPTPAPDTRMKTFLHGGFTRPQAKLLIEG